MSVREKLVLYDLMYMWNLKRQNELIETERLLVARSWKVGEMGDDAQSVQTFCYYIWWISSGDLIYMVTVVNHNIL